MDPSSKIRTLHYGPLHSPVFTDICVATESPGGFEREQMREQLGGFLGRFSMGRLRRFLSGIVYGNPFRAGEQPIANGGGPLETNRLA